MKQTFALGLVSVGAFAVLATLAGCDASGSYGYIDPALAQEYARQTLTAADSAIRRTEQARELLYAQATLDAARMLDIQNATQTAVSAYAAQTQAALDSQATATQQVINIQASATQQAMIFQATQTPLVATQQAIARREFLQEKVYEPFKATVYVLGTLILMGFAIVGIYRGVPQFWSRLMKLMEAEAIRRRTHETRDGEVVIASGDPNKPDVLMPKRGFGAALRYTEDGYVVEGMAPDLQMQSDTTARQQATSVAYFMAGRNGGKRNSLGLRPGVQVRILNSEQDLPAGMLFDPGAIARLEAQLKPDGGENAR